MHIAQHSRQRLDTLRVSTASRLAQHAFLPVSLQPGRGVPQPLSTNSGRYTVRRGTRAVGVEVLVHLIDEFVLRVGQTQKGGAVARGGPRPGAAPRVALDEDVLRRGAHAADGVDGGLVEPEDEVLVHVVVLVVGVKDDAVVGGEELGCGGPPGAEAVYVGDHLVVVAAEVVRVDDGVGAFAGDVADDLAEGG